jgi:hypothetical protein
VGIEIVLLFALSVTSASEILADGIKILEEEIEILQEQLNEITIPFNEQTIKVEQIKAEKRLLQDELDNTDKNELDKYWSTSNQLNIVKENHNKLSWKLYAMEKIKNDIEDTLELLETELELKQKSLERLEKIESVTARYQNVGIVLSNNCISMIENGMKTKCPTYGELFDNFDNTNILVSGTFSETDNDIKRDLPQYKKHWEWYNKQIVMVDPDIQFKNKSITIEIQSGGFYSFNLYESSKDFWDGERIFTYSDVKFSNSCKTVLVAPDMELIERVIEYAVTGCNGEFEIEPTVKIIPKPEEPPFPSEEWMNRIRSR